jgi:SAM-dependent methyltransferase
MAEKIFKLSRTNEEYNVNIAQGLCEACGGYGSYTFSQVINPVLAKEWKLNSVERKLWSARESMYCTYCGCSYRLRMLSKAIAVAAGDSKKSLMELIEDGLFNNKVVAEINSCGVLHEILKTIPELKYSEYESSDDNIPHEDLQKLTYENDSIDYIFTSDVIEHVPDPDKAFSEIYRTLKIGGTYVMSTPVVMNRKTRLRSHIKDGKIVHRVNPSYHGSGEPDYLVWNEFGRDLIHRIRDVGFDAYYVFVNEQNLIDPTGFIIARKTGVDNEELPAIYTEDQVLDKNWLSKRVGYLAHKITLTQNHADNLEVLINQQNQKLLSISRKYEAATAELSQIKTSIAWRILRRLKSITRIK